MTWDLAPSPTQTKVYNLRTAKTPLRRARCTSEDGVRRVVDWARGADVRFSVQSGGHCFEGFSQHEELIVDVSALASTRLERDQTLIAQPGARILQVNDTTAAAGTALPAGYCQHVALGGHVGGGGIGVLSRAHGLTCDNLISARIVTAEGSVKTASADDNSDLFWALRGGGSGSFGIVTEFHLATHTVGQTTLVDYHWILPMDNAATVLEDIQDIVLQLGRAQSAYLYLNARSPDRLYIRLRLVSLADDGFWTGAMKRMAQLPPPLTEPATATGDFHRMADLIWPRDYDPSVWIKNKSLIFSERIPLDLWRTLLDGLARQSQHDLWVSLELMGGQIDTLDRNETAFVHRRGPRILLGLAVILADPSQPQKALSGLQSIHDSLQTQARPAAYVNYPDLDMEDWQEAYWGANYARLVEVKNRYDPENLFRHAQSIRLT